MGTRDRVWRELSSSACTIDCHTHVGCDFNAYLHFAYPYALSVEDLAVRMQCTGVDYAVVFPFAWSAYYDVRRDQGAHVTTTDRFCRFPYELENKNLLVEVNETFPEYRKRMLPFAMFDPGRETRAQAKWLEGLHKTYGLFGLKCCTSYNQSFVKDFDRGGRPILEFALANDLPVIFHSAYDRQDPWARLEDIVAVARRHPQLRVCIAHSARFHKPTLDGAAELPNCFVDLSAFDIHCELVRRGNRAVPPSEERFPADYDNPEGVMQQLVEAYGEMLIWGSDVPFNYFIQGFFDAAGEEVSVTLRSRFDREVELLRSLRDEDQRQLVWSNTLRFLFGKVAVG